MSEQRGGGERRGRTTGQCDRLLEFVDANTARRHGGRCSSSMSMEGLRKGPCQDVRFYKIEGSRTEQADGLSERNRGVINAMFLLSGNGARGNPQRLDDS